MHITHSTVQMEYTSYRLRHICNASTSINDALAYTINIALVPLSMELDREVNTECSSTEEMLASIHALSARDGIWEQVIWSLGIVALDQG